MYTPRRVLENDDLPFGNAFLHETPETSANCDNYENIYKISLTSPYPQFNAKIPAHEETFIRKRPKISKHYVREQTFQVPLLPKNRDKIKNRILENKIASEDVCKVLEDEYRINPFVGHDDLRKLSVRTKLSEHVIKNWFVNRRSKDSGLINENNQLETWTDLSTTTTSPTELTDDYSDSNDNRIRIEKNEHQSIDEKRHTQGTPHPESIDNFDGDPSVEQNTPSTQHTDQMFNPLMVSNRSHFPQNDNISIMSPTIQQMCMGSPSIIMPSPIPMDPIANFESPTDQISIIEEESGFRFETITPAPTNIIDQALNLTLLDNDSTDDQDLAITPILDHFSQLTNVLASASQMTADISQTFQPHHPTESFQNINNPTYHIYFQPTFNMPNGSSSTKNTQQPEIVKEMKTKYEVIEGLKDQLQYHEERNEKFRKVQGVSK